MDRAFLVWGKPSGDCLCNGWGWFPLPPSQGARPLGNVSICPPGHSLQGDTDGDVIFRDRHFFISQRRLFLINCHLPFLGLGSVKTCSCHRVMGAHPRWTKAAMEDVSWPGSETTEVLRDQPPQTNRTKPGKAGCFSLSSLGHPKSPDPGWSRPELYGSLSTNGI